VVRLRKYKKDWHNIEMRYKIHEISTHWHTAKSPYKDQFSSLLVRERV